MLSVLLLTAITIPTPRLLHASEDAVTVGGRVIDAATGTPLPARVYINAGEWWFFPKSAAADGSAVEYRKQRFDTSFEMHTTLSPHPFTVDLPPGTYTLTVERGKEYFLAEKTITVDDKPVELEIPLRRWVDMAARGWYSGDTHVHRTIDELPNVMLAEDLNVALPLSYWVTTAHTAPSAGDKNTGKNLKPEPTYLDPTHVIYPVNTEYEIFRVGDKQHTLGAVFILGHKETIRRGVPPVAPIAAQARRQGALLDLDKHSWPWSLMLVPVMNVDLFELANNHVWRTEFGFRQWTRDLAADYMHLEQDEQGFTEWGWIDFGFQTYYALLNCGFRMRPTAGTASGVHPVPLGFGRVYVHLSDGFSYEKWIEGLDAGRSFVTTGPMLMVEVDGQPPGATIQAGPEGKTVHVTGEALSPQPLRSIELVVNGETVDVAPTNHRTESGAYQNRIDAEVTVEETSWIAVRVFEKRPAGRVRFAHTSPVHVAVPDRPLRPRREQVDFLIRRMQQEIQRNQDVLAPAALAEYEKALQTYEKIAQGAR